MTPKEILEEYNNDPLMMVSITESLLYVTQAIRIAVGAKRFVGTCDAVTRTIDHLGANGAEKWGNALLKIVVPKVPMLPVPVSAPNRLEPILNCRQITRIANASNRERLIACIVVLAEKERESELKGENKMKLTRDSI